MLAMAFMTKMAATVRAVARGDTHSPANPAFGVAAASTVTTRATGRSSKGVAKVMGSDLRHVEEPGREIVGAQGMDVASDHGQGSDTDESDDVRSGAAFVAREIETHLHAIALYEEDAASADARVREFAQRILPQLQRHLAILRSLQLRSHAPPDRCS